MNKKINFLKYLYSTTAIFLVFFCITFMTVNIYINYSNFEKKSTILKQKHINKKKETLKAGVEHFIKLINYNKFKIEKSKKQFLKSRVTIAYDITNKLYKKYKDTKSKEEIKQIIVESLRAVRFGDNGSYFISDLDGNMVLSGNRPEHEGTNTLAIQNASGVFVAKESIAFVKRQSEGFYSYMWKKSDHEDKEFEKISYLKVFEEFGWIIGTGLYESDIQNEIKQYILLNIEQMEFNYDEKNYIFIGQWDGLSLSYPGSGKNMYDLQDKNGLYLVRELIQKAKEGGGFTKYLMPSLKDEKNLQKISYSQGIDKWQWYIGAGVYIDDINEEIAVLKEEMKNKLFITSLVTLLISILMMFVFVYIHFKLNKKIKKDLEIFVEFLNSVLKTNKKIDRTKLKIREFDIMAKHANEMLKEKIHLENHLEQYKKIVSSSQDFLALIDNNYIFLTVNETYAKYFKKDIKDIEGHSAEELFGKEKFEKIVKGLEDRAFNGESYEIEHWLDFPIGKRYVHTQYNPIIKDGEEKAEIVVIASRDITDKKIDTEKLRLWAKVFENTSEAVLICDINQVIITANKAFSRITGFTEQDIIQKYLKVIQNSEKDDIFKEIFELLAKKNFWSGEIQNRKKTGELYSAFVNINVVKDEKENIINYIIVFNDITKLKNSEKMLSFLAHHDVLTKLPNRTLLKDRITLAISNTKKLNNKIAICFIDLDNFKKINDSYGHSYGDDVLLQVAERIKGSISDLDTLARIGGDEFVLLLENINDESEIKKAIFKIQKVLENEFVVNQRKFFISASIGISLYPDDAIDEEMLIKNSDIAMYNAKDSGKNTYKFFKKVMSLASFEMVNIESKLKDAIKEEQFIVYYQPQVNLKTKKVVGLEALIRWNHPIDGIISPIKFIKYAEETRMIVQIGEFVLKQSCIDLVKLQKENNYEGNISVNVSGVQIEHSDFLNTIKKIIDITKINPKKLELEITESTIMNDPSMWIDLLSNIQKSGINIAIDDFGTGYSSLSYLQKLPIDKLKIDMSFVRDIPKDENACSIANSIINLSKGMKMNTIAEGIETKEQEEFLAKNGCDEGQGYLYAKPMPIENLIIWLGNYEQ